VKSCWRSSPTIRAFRPCPTEDVGVIITALIVCTQTVDSAADRKEKWAAAGLGLTAEAHAPDLTPLLKVESQPRSPATFGPWRVCGLDLVRCDSDLGTPHRRPRLPATPAFHRRSSRRAHLGPAGGARHEASTTSLIRYWSARAPQSGSDMPDAAFGLIGPSVSTTWLFSSVCA
jgi:hypothetical protein